MTYLDQHFNQVHLVEQQTNNDKASIVPQLFYNQLWPAQRTIKSILRSLLLLINILLQKNFQEQIKQRKKRVNFAHHSSLYSCFCSPVFFVDLVVIWSLANGRIKGKGFIKVACFWSAEAEEDKKRMRKKYLKHTVWNKLNKELKKLLTSNGSTAGQFLKPLHLSATSWDHTGCPVLVYCPVMQNQKINNLSLMLTSLVQRSYQTEVW